MKQALAAFFFLFTLSGISQKIQEVKVTHPQIIVRTTQAQFLGKTKPLKDLIRKQTTPEEKLEVFEKNRMLPPNFKNRKGSNAIHPEKENQGPDRVAQPNRGGSGLVVEPVVNIDGIGDYGSPHDPTGEVGEDHFVQAVNATEVGVFTKEGVLLDQFAMATLWQDLGAQSAGDPIVLYDETEGRWILTEFTFPANLLVAVSETSDPFGSYNAYSFDTPDFPDYPKYSIWPNAYMVTTNESSAAVYTQYFMDRNAMLDGDANVTIQQVEAVGETGMEQGFIVSTPVDWDGTTLPLTDPMVLSLDDSSWGNAPEDAVRLITFDVDFANANNTTVSEISLVTAPYDSYPCSATGFGFECVPQMNGDGLDAIPEVILNLPKYRNFGTHESIVCCFVTDVTNGNNLAGIRWMEMRRDLGGEWTVYQEGTYTDPDGNDRYMGSIAIDENGNIGLGYSESSEDLFVGLRYTGRRASDPLGEMTVEEYHVVEGEGSINSNGRYGDYAQMSVDPVNGKTFWFTSEYARQGNSDVGTRIVAFEMASDTFDLSVSQIMAPVTAVDLSNAELLTVEIRNVGILPMSNYTLSFDFESVFQESVLITATLNPDETYVHQFTVPMDMSQNGTYNVVAYVSHPDDSNDSNNSLSADIINMYGLDVSGQFSIPSSSCNNELLIPFTINNLGGTTITSGTIEVSVNGTLAQTINWIGSIATGESDIENINVTGLADGANEITIEFINPNGSSDELPLDNSVTQNTDVSSASGGYQIVITTDEYPEETTWQLTDSNNNIIVSGGPFQDGLTEYSTSVCLSSQSCYVFTIYDEYGDGMCCIFGDGSYEIIDASGTLVGTGGNFNLSDVVEFCVDECTLTADIDINNDSGFGDGAILITPSNGAQNYQYSIDNGVTFQNDPLFSNLGWGTYNVVVISEDGACTFTDVISILLVSVAEISSEIGIVVKPNPNDGFFQIELSGIPSGVNYMRYEVLNSAGQLVQEKSMSRYDGVFISRVSLVAYADGIYYLRFLDSHVKELVKVLKKG